MQYQTPNSYFPLQKFLVDWQEHFGQVNEAKLVWAEAPGRVNLIGEHTDYHDGFVMPAAIDLRTYGIAAKRNDEFFRIYSVNMQKEVTLSSPALRPEIVRDWVKYIAGPIWALKDEGHVLSGADIVIWGSVPFGSGLSSSASVEIAIIKLMVELEGLELSPKQIAKLGRKAENEFVGVPCGIMDQFAAAACKDDSAVMLDCRSLEATHIPIDESLRIVVCDTGVKHALADSEYAKRQEECAEALKAVQKRHPETDALRDVTHEMLREAKEEMPALSYRRAKYVLRENERVMLFADAMKRGNKPALGKIMSEGHKGLKDEYEVSCKELDKAVALAATLDGFVGARMTGGGFGGSTVNLVEAAHAEQFAESLTNAYREFSGDKGGALLLAAGKGARSGRIEKR